MKRKILAMTLVVTMVIGLTSCGERRRTSRRHSEDVTGSSISAISAEEKEEAVEETANPNAVTLTRLGEIDDPQGKVEFNASAPVCVEGNQAFLCNYMGEKTDIDVTGGKFRDVISADDSITGKAAFEVRMPSGEVNNVGLYSEDGEELIPCNASIIERVHGSSRYLKVIYATKKTKNEKKAIFFTSNDMLSSIAPGDDDVMYEGYVQFYDLKEKRMVPLTSNITSNYEADKYEACGNSLIYDNTMNDQVIVYNADGQEIKSYTHSTIILSIGDGMYCINKGMDYQGNDTYIVCDENANELLKKTKGMQCSYGYGDYIQVCKKDDASVCDRNGQEIIPSGKYSSFEGLQGNNIFHMKKGEKNVYITQDGNEIYTSKTSDSKLSNGVFYCDAKGDTYDVVDERGLLTTTKTIPDLALYQEENGTNSYFVYNQKEYVPFSASNYTTKGVLLKTQEEETALYSLHELVDGTLLLDNCNEIFWIDNYIYASKDGKWSVYKVSIPEKYKE
ncbi:MAG: hypothetical protein V8R67_14140 [Eubacterium sp.]